MKTIYSAGRQHGKTAALTVINEHKAMSVEQYNQIMEKLKTTHPELFNNTGVIYDREV